ncbi:MAG TPA: hypothetical protein QF417_09965 [Acidimicrobiales bacterium]|jgi:hypothetical protein|uniref:Uncharacterized protein n=1 Tax=marine metagenome TaxID=408172 RepID=A0A382MPJ3_9ZZZZ|nr:hypothetical protein [Actinomycetes bacterium]MDP6106281.1 hypothetical protein [Acidimicrobiales bacterium]MCP4843609.1 hypothetical protein [Actinomycetes bacterium]MDP6240047.1 hypothetical protein [Acidimicrobiales bacterium]MDP7125008.1 hypothetical protein [Acidimicrobiales bacterium]|tara:strand:+ start:2273 stop:2836 length:564 start_codon:yes stop_codon:yes gene_type:complete
MYSHLLVPLDGGDLAQGALHPSATMARSFDATLILVGSEATLAALDVDTVHAPDVVAVRTEVDLPSSLERVGDNLPEPLAVYAGGEWQPYADAWSGDLLIFGPSSTPHDYVVGGTMLIDRRFADGDIDTRASSSIVLGFGYATADDLPSAVPEYDGQVVIPVRSEIDVVNGLVARWAGPVFLRAEDA